MPRITWSCLLLLVLALPLASCISDQPTCPTCPPEKSSRIDFIARPVRLPENTPFDTLRLVSVGVSVDRDSLTASPGQRLTFDGLGHGAHALKIVRYFTHNGRSESRLLKLQIELARGETRVIVFHNDFPLISGSPPPAGRHHRGGPDGIATQRMG